jgi:uncharacterized surface protein with fasciclin (FAS1) repeats
MFFKQLSILALVGQAFAQLPSLQQALNSSDNLSQLRTVLGLNPQLVETLSNARNITILAPSNAAFAKIDNATLSALAANTDMLTALLQYHVINSTLYGAQVTNTSMFVPTMLTNTMYSNVSNINLVNSSLI